MTDNRGTIADEADLIDESSLLRVYRTRDVFVAGGIPEGTYNPRQASKIEDKIDEYLEETGKALTVYGPSKSGKTVLVERKLPPSENLWIQGQDIQSLSDFWAEIATQLGLPVSATASQEIESGTDERIGMGIGIPKVIHGDMSSTDSKKNTYGNGQSFDPRNPAQVREALATSGKIVIIDDFHYIADETKKHIARAIKSIVRRSRLILIAVPSEAFEVVRSEPEMKLRVWDLEIPQWSHGELTEIAFSGFELLNVVDYNNLVAHQLAEVAYSSPYIMQQLCKDVVSKENGIKETCPAEQPFSLAPPANISEFLTSSAERSRWEILDALLAGPARSNRVEQILTTGESTDIYGAVLVALRNLTPPLSHGEYEVYQEVVKICTTRVQRIQVSNALEGMHKIADKERGESDPVLRRRGGRVYIEDSGFAFYLNHGSWIPSKQGKYSYD